MTEKNKGEGTLFGYRRVSSRSQSENSSLERQEIQLFNAGVQLYNIYTEIASGKGMCKQTRPVLRDLLDNKMQHGDTLVCPTLDRFGRTIKDVFFEVHSLHQRGIKILILELDRIINWDSPNDVVTTVLFSFIAQQELANREYRTRAGIERAKARHAYKGRATVITKKLKDKIAELREKKLSETEILAITKIGRSSYYKALREINNQRSDNGE